MLDAHIGSGENKITVCGSVMEITANLFELVNSVHNQLNKTDPSLAEIHKRLWKRFLTTGALFATEKELQEIYAMQQIGKTIEEAFDQIARKNGLQIKKEDR